MTWKELKNAENQRTYRFAGGETLTVANVVKLAVGDSGTHRLETQDGRKLIVPPTWLCIEIEAAEWSF